MKNYFGIFRVDLLNVSLKEKLKKEYGIDIGLVKIMQEKDGSISYRRALEFPTEIIDLYS